MLVSILRSVAAPLTTRAPSLHIRNRRPPWESHSPCSRDSAEIRPRQRTGRVAHKRRPPESLRRLLPAGRRPRLRRSALPKESPYVIASLLAPRVAASADAPSHALRFAGNVIAFAARHISPNGCALRCFPATPSKTSGAEKGYCNYNQATWTYDGQSGSNCCKQALTLIDPASRTNGVLSVIAMLRQLSEGPG